MGESRRKHPDPLGRSLEHPLQCCQRHKKPLSDPDRWDFSTAGRLIGRVLADTEIAPARVGHANGEWLVLSAHNKLPVVVTNQLPCNLSGNTSGVNSTCGTILPLIRLSTKMGERYAEKKQD